MNNENNLDEIYKEAVNGIKNEWFSSFEGYKIWYSFVINLPIKLKSVYLLNILESQVLNGGFHQYFSNKYGIFSFETLSILEIIGANQKHNLLSKALNFVNSKESDKIQFIEDILFGDMETLHFDSEVFNELDKLDDLYYKSEDDLLKLITTFLSKI